MNSFSHDLRYAARWLRKSPGFAVIVIAILALGIGANTTIFSVVDAVLLRPMPYADAGRLVCLWNRLKSTRDFFFSSPDGLAAVSLANFRAWREQSHSFDEMAAFRDNDFSLTGGDEAVQVPAEEVSADFFRVLGAKPSLGRDFTSGDEELGRGRAVMLSYTLWQSRFHAHPQIVGRAITLDNQPGQIIGVMPSSFHFLITPGEQWPQLWTVANARSTAAPENQFWQGWQFDVVARLRPSANVAAAQSELAGISGRVFRAEPQLAKVVPEAAVVPLHEQVSGKLRPALLVLLGGVGFVLLIACANAANLLLARMTGRRREAAVRAALGASRRRLIQQALAETLLLAAAAGVVGILFSYWSLELVRNLLPRDVPRLLPIEINLPVLLFTTAVCIVAGLLFGVAPALRLSRPDLNAWLSEGARAGTLHSGMRKALVICELALSLVLMVGAGLMIQTFLRLTNVNIGFNPHDVLVAELPAVAGENAAQRQLLFTHLRDRVATLPGTQSAALTTAIPLHGASSSSFSIEGRPAPHPWGEDILAVRIAVSPDYFRTLHIPLLAGRDFSAGDDAHGIPVLVISQSTARRYWPNQNPLGRRVKFGGPGTPAPWYQVVGVVGDVRQFGLAQPAQETMYVSYLQEETPEMALVTRTSLPPAALVDSIRHALRELDRHQPIARTFTMEQVFFNAAAPQRFNMLMYGFFAAAALLLACLGVYGVTAYAVSQRTRELGLRIALGARRDELVWMVLGEGARLALPGIVIGALGAFALTRLLSNLLFGVRPGDPMTFAVVCGLLFAVAMVASYIPARRASAVDPLTALRYE